MTTDQIFVENIKCGGCINSIKTALLKLNGVTGVEVYINEDKICVSGIAVEKDTIVAKLAALGYPQKGSNNLLRKVQSIISCAAGKMDKIK